MNDESSTEMPRPAPTARALLMTLQIASAAVLAFALLYGVLVTSMTYAGKSGEFTFDAIYVAPDDPAIRGSVDDTFFTYDLIAVSSHEPLAIPRTLAAAAVALPFLIVLVGCVCVFMLTRRLLSGRPFSRPAQAGLTVLGVLAAASAIAVPWLTSQISFHGIAQLGLPTSETVTDHATEAWVVPAYFDLVQDMNWPLFTLGVILLLIAFLWQHAARMQRDQEGLV